METREALRPFVKQTKGRSKTHLQIRIVRELIRIPRNSKNVLIRSGRLVASRVIQREQTRWRDLIHAAVSLSRRALVIRYFLNEDMRHHSSHGTEVRSRCDGGNMLVQCARKAISHRTDDSFSGDNVLIHAVFGVEHLFNLVYWDSDSYPVTGIRPREGGAGIDVVVSQPSFEGFNGRGTRSNELINLLFRQVVSVSRRSGGIRERWTEEAFTNTPVVIRVADLVQVFKELVEPVLLQPDIHFQQVIRGRLANFNPALGNLDPFMPDFQLLPTFVESD